MSEELRTFEELFENADKMKEVLETYFSFLDTDLPVEKAIEETSKKLEIESDKVIEIIKADINEQGTHGFLKLKSIMPINPEDMNAGPVAGMTSRNNKHRHNWSVGTDGNGKTIDTISFTGLTKKHTHRIRDNKILPVKDEISSHTHDLV